jgi:hypothetical protein
MPRTKLLQGSVPVTFRLAREIHQRLRDKARRDQISVSELIRKVLIRETTAGFPPGDLRGGAARKRRRAE